MNPILTNWLARFSGRRGWGVLGPLEYAVMLALWSRPRRPASVRDLLPMFPRLGYTTLMTTLDRLYKKGLIDRERRGRLNAYWPAISRQDLRMAIASQILTASDES